MEMYKIKVEKITYDEEKTEKEYGHEKLDTVYEQKIEDIDIRALVRFLNAVNADK